ncbi:MAG: outer membrane protein assembly factor BamD [Acetobacteraceae bacterium]|nr:outer membrane protein assembly factor BamD [Acetobacteraceae bacterium]
MTQERLVRFPTLATLGRGACLALLLAPLLAGCGGGASERKADASVPVRPVEELYNNGMDALAASRYATAADQFNAIEQNYPYSTWAARAQLMLGYTQYLRNNYDQAIATLDRYIQLHPVGQDVAYASYLRALCFYEQIEDVQRDQKATMDAMAALKDVADRYPGTDYARDARLKIDLARDHLAGKEMTIGRYYEDQHLYEAAINRFQRVVLDYQTTNHVPEALERLVEVYLKLGLRTEAERTAAVLGYNYPGSAWYQDAYRMLARDRLVAQDPANQPGFFTRAWRAIF